MAQKFDLNLTFVRKPLNAS